MSRWGRSAALTRHSARHTCTPYVVAPMLLPRRLSATRSRQESPCSQGRCRSQPPDCQHRPRARPYLTCETAERRRTISHPASPMLHAPAQTAAPRACRTAAAKNVALAVATPPASSLRVQSCTRREQNSRHPQLSHLPSCAAMLHPLLDFTPTTTGWGRGAKDGAPCGRHTASIAPAHGPAMPPGERSKQILASSRPVRLHARRRQTGILGAKDALRQRSLRSPHREHRASIDPARGPAMPTGRENEADLTS